MKTMQLCMLLGVLFLSVAAVSAKTNITEELQKEPTYSEFNDILTKSGLAAAINGMNSITVLALPNSAIDSLRGSLGPAATDKQLADIIRVHVLLQYVDPTDIKKSINGSQQVTTMYQSTGKAPGQDGIANLTLDKAGTLGLSMSNSNATIVKSVKQIPYNLSIVEVSNVLLPTGVLAAAPSPAPSPTTVPAPSPSSVPSPSPLLTPTPAAAPLSDSSPSLSPSSSSTAPSAPSDKSNSKASPLSSPTFFTFFITLAMAMVVFW